MSDQQVDNSKRRFLLIATGVAGAVAGAGVATPFIASFFPSERAKAAGAPVELDISKLELGQQVTTEWRGKPVWVVKRTPEMLANLPKLDGKLTDPTSAASEQPEYCNNANRSIKPEIWVALGVCTHLGCSPTFRPDLAPADLGPEWLGGFYCPCHGSKFDLAGRVYSGVPAPKNLVIPPHKYITEARLLIGDDK
ncbi:MULTISPECIES: ubiquinol-cytochrome c reductase iron-sulfur subunit [Iodobacter]|jgi:ubiquinol-cytochrome c reductase iron-sulfur subunit|uniref:Ubiquinol-cytochrome c reductase iron-sulfur subunit n=2 Tax=Iodobacter TaxID=32014 RepID=A0A377SUK8_9NEIS|nr:MULTISPECIES: ubiquinol-cytochrome c reductase iron-sulfur subunit [Iodobacter]NHQ87381.1 ubiquinol-cytochrome c reductase iron-sulfur subunit [Iodobacter violacea]TCU85564.1 ubiquinol-cytochrome c reductase iron-sulfur subunit [Iodobacter fluviatilis]STR44988.1 Ubiquinol-cytochrome c reductase iron-sulfur subunit [Iodobacter fluviatilis]